MSKHEFFPKKHDGEKVVFENGQGAMIISSIRDVLEIAAKGNPEDPTLSARPSQQQAQEAVIKLRLQMA